MSTKSGVETQALHEAVRTQLAPSLLPHFHAYREQLIQENARDLGHDEGTSSPASASGTSTPQAGTQNGAVKTSATAASIKETKTSASKSSLSTTKVEVEADLSISKEDLWDLLTNQARIPMWTRAPAQVRETFYP